MYLNAIFTSDENKLKDSLEDGNALNLIQDLQAEIRKHKAVENQIDLLIVDETHFGARANLWCCPSTRQQ